MKVKLALGEITRAFELRRQGDQLTVIDEQGRAQPVHLLRRDGVHLELSIQGVRVRLVGAVNGHHKHVWINGRLWRYQSLKEGVVHHVTDPQSLSVTIPAVVSEVLVEVGDAVQTGDKLILLESMKMVLSIQAPYAGVVKAVHCRKGQAVDPGIALIEVEAHEARADR